MSKNIRVSGRAAGRYAKKTKHNGRTYDSKAEAAHAADLDNLVKANRVRFWIPQPLIELGHPGMRYRPDFMVAAPYWANSQLVFLECHEVKGVDTAEFRRIVELWRRAGPCDLVIYRKGKEPERIVPNGQAV